jgi:FKBP-type peptidyl-prolyl cis-trans isomerase FklB
MTQSTRIVASHGRERMVRAMKNRQEGRAFLDENGKKEGVMTLPSGLQYRVIKEGGGVSPGPGDPVTVHYRGTLVDGSEFDSSFSSGQPATFQTSGVIAGWTQALQLMKEGAKWELFLPPDLAYGAAGAPPAIGPDCTLVFEVELLKVHKG